MVNRTQVITTPATNQKSKAWTIAGIAGGSALVLGGIGAGAYFLINNNHDDIAQAKIEEPEPEPFIQEEPAVDELIVDTTEPTSTTYSLSFDPANMQQSFAVTDDMSFAQAFAAAREEVGPGGVFVWHGDVFGTYTADEWNSMSEADQMAFASNFDYAELDPQDDIVEAVPEDDSYGVMLISQTYDNDYGMNIAYVTDGENIVMLADADNDGTYDFCIGDFDGNGEISNDEIIDIYDVNLTHNDVACFPEL